MITFSFCLSHLYGVRRYKDSLKDLLTWIKKYTMGVRDTQSEEQWVMSIRFFVAILDFSYEYTKHYNLEESKQL